MGSQSAARSPTAAARFLLADPGYQRLRAAAVTMSAVLLSFGSALIVEILASLTSSSVVLAVVLAFMLGRPSPHAPGRSRLLAAFALPFLAVAGSYIASAMVTHPNIGDCAFVLGVCAAIWVRRFGEQAKRVGSLATATLVAALITPGPIVAVGGSGGGNRWWAAVIAALALFWVTTTRAVAIRAGVLEHADSPGHSPTPAPPRARARRRLAASSRMAVQMGVALGAAFAAGRGAFGEHWTWTVLTAFIVCSGNRGRGDVLHKAAMRILGAAVGTLAATLLAGAFPPADDWSIVTMFTVLAVALWLRPLNYAYWAAGMTAALSLLYGYYGDTGGHLLTTRLAAIGIGALIAVASSWLLLPVRTVDVVRRYLAEALLALSSCLADPQREPTVTPADAVAIRAAVTLAHQVALPLRWQRRLPVARQSGLPYLAATSQLAASLPALGALVGQLLGPEPGRVASDLGAARRALAANAEPVTRAQLVPAAERIADALRCWPHQTVVMDGPHPSRDAMAAGGPTGEGASTELPGRQPTVASSDRARSSTERVLGFVNRAHGTGFVLGAATGGMPVAPAVLSYAVGDPDGGPGLLVWSRDPAIVDLAAHCPAANPSPAAAALPTAEALCGVTSAGYPYRLMRWPGP